MPPRAESSAESRLANFKNKKSQVALLHNLAVKMLEQAKADHMEVNRQIDQWMQRDDQKFEALLEDGERDRKLFQETMRQHTALMKAAVDALKRLGNVSETRPSSNVAPERGPPCPSSQALAAVVPLGPSTENRSSSSCASTCQAQTSSVVSEANAQRGQPRTVYKAASGPHDPWGKGGDHK